MCKEKVAIKGMLDFDSTAALLEELAKSYRNKTVCIEMGKDVICLNPGEYIDVEVEASVKKGKQKMTIELAWKEELLSEETKLKISSKMPEAKLVKPNDVAAVKANATKDAAFADDKSAKVTIGEKNLEKENPKNVKAKVELGLKK